MVEFGAQTHSRSLFLSDFSRICGSGAIELLQKRPAKKNYGQTNRFRADREAGGTPFRPPKTQIPPAKALKTGSATKSEILLTSRLKEAYIYFFFGGGAKKSTFWDSGTRKLKFPDTILKRSGSLLVRLECLLASLERL